MLRIEFIRKTDTLLKLKFPTSVRRICSRSYSGILPRSLFITKRLFSSSSSSSGDDHDDDDANASKGDGAESGPGEPRKGKEIHGVIAPVSGFRHLAKKSSNIIVPETLTVIPLYRRPLFPSTSTPIVSESPEFVEHLRRVAESDTPYAGLFLARDSTASGVTQDLSQVHTIGTMAKIEAIIPVNDPREVHNLIEGNFRYQPAHMITLSGKNRVRILNSVPNTRWPTARVEQVVDFGFDENDLELKAFASETLRAMRELLRESLVKRHNATVYPEMLNFFLRHTDITQPGQIADLGAYLTNGSAEDLQYVVEERDVKRRLQKALQLLNTEIKVAQLEHKVRNDVQQSVNRQQKRYYLMEQLKTIKRELGMETDEKQTLLDKFHKNLEGKTVPPDVMTTINEEINKLQTTDQNATEFNVTRNYLEWLTLLPWGLHSEENFDLKIAEKVLNEDHYGLEDVKERILEFIAVGALRKSVEGKILCLVGPPGVGKTSIGKSIARALSREFYRFSVGGLHDVAEIKGHRRTYVGSMPGKIIQCFKKVKKANPVILIDEIDKMGRQAHHGDPSSALLEVLDPEQNNGFLDHYLDVPFDLSKVLFVCTANVTDTIPAPLLDRMEVIRLSGYVESEKIEIARKYLVPQALADSGLAKSQVSLTPTAIRALIKSYCREAGVRNLGKKIERVLRKVAYLVVKGEKKRVTVSERNLEVYVGKPAFTSDRHYERTPPGVVTGLAWTSMGGATLYVESAVDHFGKGNKLRRSGKMGDVMRESADIAYTFAKAFLARLDNHNDFFEKNSIHMHLPEGAVPKDGPSAGITMVTSLLSLALERSVQHNLAMSGELTLTGKVLAVGGLKEKTIGARRSGVNTLIFPEQSRKEWEEIPKTVTEGMKVHFVETYEEVFDLAFGSAVSQRKNSRAKRVSPAVVSL